VPRNLSHDAQHVRVADSARDYLFLHHPGTLGRAVARFPVALGPIAVPAGALIISRARGAAPREWKEWQMDHRLIL
jgi:hypothetical protein